MTIPSLTDIQTLLTNTRQDLLDFLQTLSPTQWETPVYADGNQWTISDLLRHLNRAETGMIRLMDNIRQGGEGASANFDLVRYNASGVHKQKHKTPAQLLTDMQQNRQDLWQFIASLTPEDLAQQGRHGSGQILTVAQILEIIAQHDRTHLHDMRSAL